MTGLRSGKLNAEPLAASGAKADARAGTSQFQQRICRVRPMKTSLSRASVLRSIADGTCLAEATSTRSALVN